MFIENVATGLFVNACSSAVGTMFKNKKELQSILKLISISDKDVRFSISYLFRIKIDEKYLLIKGGRIEQYQPIGGVYKYNDLFLSKIDEWGIMNDEGNIPLDDASKKDLRVRVPKKYVSTFIKWFESKKDRETTVFREFEEEVLNEIPEKSYLFSNSLFQPRFIRRNNNGLKYSKHFDCHEILIADIFEIVLTKEQETALKELVSKNTDFKLVSAKDIERDHFMENGMSYRIGEHTKETLENGGK